MYIACHFCYKKGLGRHTHVSFSLQLEKNGSKQKINEEGRGKKNEGGEVI